MGMREEAGGLRDIKLLSALPKANVLMNRFVELINRAVFIRYCCARYYIRHQRYGNEQSRHSRGPPRTPVTPRALPVLLVNDIGMEHPEHGAKDGPGRWPVAVDSACIDVKMAYFCKEVTPMMQNV